MFLTTHYLEEADRYAERVMVMDKGRVIADDTADALKAELAGDVLTFGFASDADAERAVAVVQGLTDRDGAARGRGIRRRSPRRTATRCCRRRCGRWTPRASRVARATGVPPTLDDVFLALTGRTLREAGEGEPSRRDRRRADADRGRRIRQKTGAER